MSYYKPSELTEKFHVSAKTVYNWITAAKAGKNDLKLYDKGNSSVVAKTQENDIILEKLAEAGKRHRNTAYYKVVSPKPAFFSVYNDRQILDIITNLSAHAEIPLQYSYLQDGAKRWDERMKRFESEGKAYSLTGTIALLDNNLATIDRLIQNKTKVNVIDLGVGNAHPVKSLLTHFRTKGVLHRYIAVDISPSMLEIAKNNIKEWFGDSIKFEGYIRDISREQFDDLVVADMLDQDADHTINIVLLLGGTSVNFRSPTDVFKPIFNSMHQNDLLVHSLKPDTEVSRRNLDFGPTPGFVGLPPHFKYIPDLLNIDDSLYEAEIGFDFDKKMRYVRVRLKVAIDLQFDLGGTKRRSVTLEKGQAILLFRAWHRSTSEIITELGTTGFTLLHASLTEDRQFFLSISGIGNQTDADRS